MALNRPITHIDCFAGPGGICTGLSAARYQTLVAIEYVKSCCDTYSANHPEVHVIHSDIRKVTKRHKRLYTQRRRRFSYFWYALRNIYILTLSILPNPRRK